MNRSQVRKEVEILQRVVAQPVQDEAAEIVQLLGRYERLAEHMTVKEQCEVARQVAREYAEARL